MRAKVVIPILFLFLIFLFLCFLLKKDKRVNEVPLVTQSAHTGTVISNMTTPLKTTVGIEPQSPLARPTVADFNSPEKTNELLQYIESKNAPISFFGKVVDQDGNPLPEARIQGQVIHVIVALPADGGGQDQIIPVETNTDVNGRFEVHGLSGRDFGIGSILKDGYEVESLRRDWTTSAGSIESPLVFKMWSTNIHEKLITGEKSFDIVPDGKPYFIDLTDDTISQSAKGDLKVWIQYTNQPVRGQLCDWSAEIDVVSGGLLEEPLGSAMFEAPTDGYTPSFVLKKQIRGSERGQIGGRQFYLLLKNGGEYGQMSINLLAPYNDQIPGMIRLSYAVNPSGSRILR